MAVSTRDLDLLTAGLTRWWTERRDGGGLPLTVEPVTGSGYSNEMLFLQVGDDVFVVRLPPDGAGMFPDYDLVMQAEVQSLVARFGVPVPAPIEVEIDAGYVGAPFLVMPRVSGLIPGDLPAFDPWIVEAGIERQRALHEGFLDVLATIHRVPLPAAPPPGLRRPVDLDDEVATWERLVAWTFDGEVPAPFAAAFAWCRRHLPASMPEVSVLWGDVRLGNVIYSENFAPVAVLDWEMASIGPAELDLGWYLATEALGAHFVDQRVPGFLDHDAVVDRHRHALGRDLPDLPWYEAFAMVRTAVLHCRTGRLKALRKGRPLPDADPSTDPVLGRVLDLLDLA